MFGLDYRSWSFNFKGSGFGYPCNFSLQSQAASVSGSKDPGSCLRARERERERDRDRDRDRDREGVKRYRGPVSPSCARTPPQASRVSKNRRLLNLRSRKLPTLKPCAGRTRRSSSTAKKSKQECCRLAHEIQSLQIGSSRDVSCKWFKMSPSARAFERSSSRQTKPFRNTQNEAPQPLQA